LLWVAVLTACSGIGMQAKRDVVDHTFYASNPNMAIKLADDFIYRGENRSHGHAAYKNHPGGTVMTMEHHHFYNQAEGKTFMVIFKKLNKGYIIPNFNASIANPLETGEVDENGQKYQYAIFADKDVKGNCYLVKRLVRTSGGNGRMLVVCIYAQQLQPPFSDYTQWQNPNRLDENQREFLAEFSNAFEEDIQFVKKQISMND
ncbi:MAG: hypothetical protein PVI90_15130, partial [Desulfobacteraceae bacterium]